MSDWINVDDRLPQEFQEVLFIATNESGIKKFFIGHMEKGNWLNCYMFYCSAILNEDLVKVIFWMPLPNPPENEK